MTDGSSVLQLLACLMAAASIAGCSSLRGESSGVAIGEGRAQACRSACSAAGGATAADAASAPATDRIDSCQPCQCDQLAGHPAICTTSRTRLP